MPPSSTCGSAAYPNAKPAHCCSWLLSMRPSTRSTSFPCVTACTIWWRNASVVNWTSVPAASSATKHGLFIEFYFVITALFYTETYLSERFYSDKKETFLSFIPNRLDKIIFTAIICGILQYFCSYFFDIDDHLRRILKNTKKNQVDLALAQFVKNIKNKFIILIVISMIITIFGFFYIACFNIVYPYIKHEWLKCSILMILLMQILNLLSTLLGACCRYFSIKWQNVKLFRLSLNLNWV